MIPEPVLSYEERRQELALLERLTAQARLLLAREANQIQAPRVEASAEGVLISEILGIFLFLFLLGGMLLFFHKETNCTAEGRRRLRCGAHRLYKTVRRRLFRFHREWNCEEETSGSTASKGPGVYRGTSNDDVTEVELPSLSPPTTTRTTFDHRQALLELFADLELHQEVVRHSLRGYSPAFPQLDDQAVPPARTDPGKMSPLCPSKSRKVALAARSSPVKVASLPGILRAPTAVFSTRGQHRRGYHHHHRHHHHHHHHRHRGCSTIAEEHQRETSGVTAEPTSDVTARWSGRSGDVAALGEAGDATARRNAAGTAENRDDNGLYGERARMTETGMCRSTSQSAVKSGLE